MKKILILFLLLFLTFCQNKKENNQIILSVKIEIPNSDSLLITAMDGKIIHKMALNSNGTVKDTITLKEGFYTLFDKVEQAYVYLKPGYNLNITFDTKQFDETIKYSGVGEKENNYLAQKTLLNESFGKLNSYKYYATLDENDFLKLTDSLHNELTMLFNKNKYDEDFAYQEENTLKYERLTKLANYESMKRFVTNDRDFKVSDNFPKIFEKVDLSNEKLLDNPFYIYYIEIYLNYLFENENNNTNGITLKYLNIVDSLLDNQKIKEKIASQNGLMYLTYAKDIDGVYNKIISMLTDESQKKEIEEEYLKLKKLSKGAASPTFSFKDNNGKTVSLEDLRGKIVYIDIWATWCGPCQAELPYLKKLEEELRNKDIYFVSICKNDTKDKWQKIIKEKQLKGIQLFAELSETSFFDAYQVTGIPRFILLDKEGKIIDANAKRPSNPELKKELESLL